MSRITITKNRAPKTSIRRTIEFDSRIYEGCGYSFDADEKWQPIFEAEPARKSWEYCMSHPEELEGPTRRTYEQKYTEPAEGKCSCGETVVLNDQYLGACQCPKCGQWYNLFGQALLDPEYWEDDEA